MIQDKPIILIEHLESELSPWLFLEYRHSSLIYGKEFLLISNLPRRYHRLISKYAMVSEKSVKKLIKEGEINGRCAIILDPKSPRKLDFNNVIKAKYIIVGGILGEHPPRGRTFELITRELEGVESFNIGAGQFSIDGTVFYLQYLLSHRGDEDFKYIDGVTIDDPQLGGRTIYLPYRYPLIDGEPLLPPGLKYYLINGRLPEELWKEIRDP
ncbi:MAG: RNA methyltransferase [Thermosphaera sp.]